MFTVDKRLYCYYFYNICHKIAAAYRIWRNITFGGFIMEGTGFLKTVSFGGFDKKFQIYHQQEAEYAKILTVLINGKQNKK